jgi:hypothetical protein
VNPTRGQLAAIHIAKKDLGLDEETYRGMLQEVTGRRSAKDLDHRQAQQVIDHLKKRGWCGGKRPNGPPSFPPRRGAVGRRKFEDLGERPDMASPGQLRKVEVMWKDVAIGDPAKTLRRFIWRLCRVSDLRFLSAGQAHEVIEAIKAIRQRRTR